MEALGDSVRCHILGDPNLDAEVSELPLAWACCTIMSILSATRARTSRWCWRSVSITNSSLKRNVIPWCSISCRPVPAALYRTFMSVFSQRRWMAVVQLLPNIPVMSDHWNMIELAPEQVPEIVTRRDRRVFLIGMIERVGVVPLIGAIEWFWYPPTSSRNKFYDLYAVQWHGLGWVIVAFPGLHMPRVQALGIPPRLAYRQWGAVDAWWQGCHHTTGSEWPAV